jgi:hypothetical protein
VLLKITENVQIVEHLGAVIAEVSDTSDEELTILLAFLLEGFSQLLHLMSVVEVFNGLLEADGDEEADDDGGDVDEEVFPGVSGFVGRVYVEHIARTP